VDTAERVGLVTGGSRGLGRAIALGLAEAGADVAINYRRDEEAAVSVAEAVERLGRRARIYRASVSDADEAQDLVKQVVSDFGFVDILVNNAGIASRGLPVAETEPAELLRVVGVHAFGPHYLSRAVLPSMRARPRGDIIMISSIGTLHPTPNGAPYTMGKAAMEALAFTLAKEERQYGVRVNVVAPGLLDTDMGRRSARAATGVADIHDLDERSGFGRVCRPEDVAGVVRFLVSDAGGYITGTRIVVDGGTDPVLDAMLGRTLP
jgi:NAD(P)-dependent dehydrogenase (short-subunit alcohol dehydrogenase family)